MFFSQSHLKQKDILSNRKSGNLCHDKICKIYITNEGKNVRINLIKWFSNKSDPSLFAPTTQKRFSTSHRN